MTRRSLMLMAAVLCAALLALMASAPFMAPYGTFSGLDGTAANVDHGWMGHGPAGLAYLIGDVLCHQQEARSYILNGSQMPVCIRDVWIVAGAAAGFAVCSVIERRMSDRRMAVIGIALVAVMGIEWIVETTVGDMPVPRALSGLSCGVGAAVFLSWMLCRDSGKPYLR